ncbi:MAG: bifunctional phosphopantothenoylcysteine decarboxylase/phosphopantothenate--cysteine ligase CoaBC [Rickettsiales bacterium]|nr:bifunctional phosphopantothenoylcysteine decarboxylase/phosphopantothenate--cysteine ligase CoaBC [Rickettsiales bacterium]
MESLAYTLEKNKLGNLKKKKRILVIVTGGIAVYKTLDLIRLLLKNEFSLDCILTESVKNFVSLITFESLLGKKVFSDLFASENSEKINHIELGQNADLIIVCPATANFISKMANGIADDLASTVLLATKSKIFVAPAMNTNMLTNIAIRDNLKTLKKRGVKILTTTFGKLACGTVGNGKLLEVEKIFEHIKDHFLSSNLLKGKNIVVTSGPSIENLDPVRFLSNFSSGRQGYEIAKAISNAGAKTTLITGPTSIDPPSNVKIVNVKTGEDFLNFSLKNLPADVFVSVAAISDWKILKYSNEKIKKKKNMNLKLVKNVDVLKTISFSNLRPKLIIGFSAESQNLEKNSLKKIKEKKCDWILANSVSNQKVFNSNTNKVLFIDNNKVYKWPRLKKSEIAERLVKKISEFFKTERIKFN